MSGGMGSGSPRWLGHLVVAELRKLASRTSARAGWLLMGLVGFVPVLALSSLGEGAVQVNGQAAVLDLGVPNGAHWALWVRHFYVAQAVILLLGAVSVAGELRSGTLREDLVRPVPRWGVLLAKWCALIGWSAVALGLQLGVALLAGALMLSGAHAEIALVDVAKAYGLSLLTEGSFAAVVLALAVWSRSVAGTVASVFLFLVLERFVSWSLWLGRGFAESLSPDLAPSWMGVLFGVQPWLPSAAWGVWAAVAEGAPPALESLISLLVITGGAVVLAERRFEWMDVP